MGLAMSDLARMLLNFGSSEVAKEQIRAKVTEEELTMLQVFGMNDSTGMFTRTEFVILSLMQLRVLTPTSVEEINKRFDTLDIGQTGFLATNDIIHKASSRRLSNMFKNSSISDQNRKISGMNGRVIDKNLGS